MSHISQCKPLVPREAHVMALNGLAQLMTTIEAVRDRLNEHIKVLGSFLAASRQGHATVPRWWTSSGGGSPMKPVRW